MLKNAIYLKYFFKVTTVPDTYMLGVLNSNLKFNVKVIKMFIKIHKFNFKKNLKEFIRIARFFTKSRATKYVGEPHMEFLLRFKYGKLSDQIYRDSIKGSKSTRLNLIRRILRFNNNSARANFTTRLALMVQPTCTIKKKDHKFSKLWESFTHRLVNTPAFFLKKSASSHRMRLTPNREFNTSCSPLLRKVLCNFRRRPYDAVVTGRSFCNDKQMITRILAPKKVASHRSNIRPRSFVSNNKIRFFKFQYRKVKSMRYFLLVNQRMAFNTLGNRSFLQHCIFNYYNRFTYN